MRLGSLSFLILSLLVITGCGGVSNNPVLEEDFGRGHNGLLWGEKRNQAINWIKLSKRIPVQVATQSDNKVRKQARDFRKTYLKALKLRAVPNIKDNYLVTYNYLGRTHILNFDQNDRFCSVTFGPRTPAPPLGEDGSFKSTAKKFSAKIIKPLEAKYGKPKIVTRDKKALVRRYWVWKSKTVSYVVELIFVRPQANIPAFWQYSESISLASVDFYR